jgi:excisionase family DNA binding protein
MLRISVASPLLDIPASTLRRLCAKGKVPAVKVGRSWRVKGGYVAEVTGWTAEAES